MCRASPVSELSPCPLSSGGQAAALVRSHVNGSMALVKTIEQITETMPPSPKTITTATIAASLLSFGRDLALDEGSWVQVPFLNSQIMEN